MNCDKNILNSVKNIHFIGIGGSGMCPIAEIFSNKGYNITGSDNYVSDTLQGMVDKGVKIFINHDPKNVENADLVVYSAAIKEDNIERVAARERNIPCIERSVALGLICQKFKNTIAVSGTHGKTTTTAMITQILIAAGKDPSAIIGGKLPYIGGNSRVGASDIIVCEACEYVDTFLQINPSVAVITNIDADHLDYFGTLENLIKSFHKFAAQTDKYIVINGDDLNTLKSVESISVPIITFGKSNKNIYQIDYNSENNIISPKFSLIKDNKKILDINLSISGKHNVFNATAAAIVALTEGIDPKIISDTLNKFSGVHRRFEILGKYNNITVADDFAHHPTEIRAVLSTATHLGFDRVIAVFQPHTYTRTVSFLNEFANALNIANLTILSEILAVREINVSGITSEDLAKKIKNCVCLHTFEEIANYVVKIARPNDLILTMGGGNVYVCANMIVQLLEKNIQ